MRLLFNWLIGIVVAAFVKFVIEDPIEAAILKGFKISFPPNSPVVTLIEMIEIAVALGIGFWVITVISKHPFGK